MNALTEFIDDDLLLHDLLSKRREVWELTLNDDETAQYEAVELTLSDRLQMAIQGQPLYVVGAVCFSLICAASTVAAVVGHLVAVFCGAPWIWS